MKLLGNKRNNEDISKNNEINDLLLNAALRESLKEIYILSKEESELKSAIEL